MKRFLERHGRQIIAVLSGFDRLVFRGVLRSLAVVCGMMDFLSRKQVRLKDFGDYVKQTSQQLQDASCREAETTGRPVQYVPSPKTNKEEIARSIAEADGVTEGLICVLTCVEPCKSYTLYRDRASKTIDLRLTPRKCLHLYHYSIDPVFGFMNARIQAWFPFWVQVCINGREWLARAMDREGLGYQRADNCFTRLEDPERAQEIMDGLLRTAWPETLRRIARQLNPDHEALLRPYVADYYWTVYQSEWATDLLYGRASDLDAVYPHFVHHAMTTFGSDSVMRFLGRKLMGNYRGNVITDFRRRQEGVRVKHWAGANSVKVYNKHGSVLRVETTINTPQDFKVYRPKEGDPGGPKSWRRMRKGVADLHRRAQVSHATNERYLDALASTDTDTPVGELLRSICRPVRWQGQRHRALRPWSDDRELLSAVSRGEFALNGFRNRDLQALLFPGAATDPKESQRCRSQITRRLRLLRAHGLIKKVPSTHRYLLTKKGRFLLTAVLATQTITLAKLTEAAA